MPATLPGGGKGVATGDPCRRCADARAKVGALHIHTLRRLDVYPTTSKFAFNTVALLRTHTGESLQVHRRALNIAMLASAQFRDAAVEAQYRSERAHQLTRNDMRSAFLFTLLWAWDCCRCGQLLPRGGPPAGPSAGASSGSSPLGLGFYPRGLGLDLPVRSVVALLGPGSMLSMQHVQQACLPVSLPIH